MAGEADTLAARFSRRLKKNNAIVTVAESCTGGLLTSTLTDISGASKWFKQAWVVYSNEVKANLLGVDSTILEEKGAVNEEVAEQMANGALKRANADFSIAITGIAGPKSDDSIKEVGLVYVSITDKETSTNWTKEARFSGGRHENKQAFVVFALRLAIEFWDKLREKETSDQTLETQPIIDEVIEEENLELEPQEEIEEDDPWGGNLGDEWRNKINEINENEDNEIKSPSINTDEVEWEEN